MTLFTIYTPYEKIKGMLPNIGYGLQMEQLISDTTLLSWVLIIVLMVSNNHFDFILLQSFFLKTFFSLSYFLQTIYLFSNSKCTKIASYNICFSLNTESTPQICRCFCVLTSF